MVIVEEQIPDFWPNNLSHRTWYELMQEVGGFTPKFLPFLLDIFIQTLKQTFVVILVHHLIWRGKFIVEDSCKVMNSDSFVICFVALSLTTINLGFSAVLMKPLFWGYTRKPKSNHLVEQLPNLHYLLCTNAEPGMCDNFFFFFLSCMRMM